VNTMSATVLDRQGVINKFGVPPERIIDYLALIGDSVDNIPGVAKVGPKTAVKWLTDYGDLKTIIERAEEFTGKLGENLKASLTSLPLSQQLVTLKLDVPTELHWQDLKPKAAEEEKLIELFKRLEFKTWLNDLLGKQAAAAPAKVVNYQTILSQAQLTDCIEKLSQAPLIAFNAYLTEGDAMTGELLGLSFASETSEAIYIPFAHDYENAPAQLSRSQVLKVIAPLLQDKSKQIIGHQLKTSINILAHYGIKILATVFDTMVESYVLDSTSSRHDLETLALKFLGRKTLSFEEIAGKGAKQKSLSQIELQTATAYAAENASVILQLHITMWSKIKNNEETQNVFTNIDMPLVSVLAQMEYLGVMIDAKLLEKQSQDLATRLKQLEDEVYLLAGAVFNLSSPKQLQEILYEKLKLPILSKTPTGVPSTAEAVLQELALDYPLPKLILEYRSLSKLKSTYTDALPKQINVKTQRVHTNYNQAVTSTGRLSSTDPNLQNIPIRHEEGRRVRQAFIAPAGYKIISADYSQIELRIMAHLSQDEGLIKAFSEGVDIHRATSAEVLGIPLEKVSSEQRRHAKAINFGLIYGMSAFGLAKQLGIERQLAQNYMDLYFSRYPKVLGFMESIRDLARQQGYVETLLGRRLYVPEINTSNLQRRRAAERAAINAPMQGTAADIIKIAMIELHKQLKSTSLDAKMIMQVHDELVFEVAEKDVDKAMEVIKKTMVNAVQLTVPLEVEIKSGNNWDEAH
jgi:DNA polymerase-1